MERPVDTIGEMYGNQVRLRVCGLYTFEGKILLVNHALYGSGSDFWSPPGGGVHFGEPASVALQREFEEETGLIVEIGELIFTNEFIQPPLHAIELFFKIDKIKGQLGKGMDPEFSIKEQIIKEVKFVSLEDLHAMPAQSKHAVLLGISSFDELFVMKGLLSKRRLN